MSDVMMPPNELGPDTFVDFDPFGASALADPYPDFARFVEHEAVFWSDELGDCSWPATPTSGVCCS